MDELGLEGGCRVRDLWAEGDLGILRGEMTRRSTGTGAISTESARSEAAASSRVRRRAATFQTARVRSE